MAEARFITIFAPNPGTTQPWACFVKGSAFGGDVQIMVKAADDKWYPQPHVQMRNNIFKGTAYLGWEENPQAKHYTIATGVGGSWIPDVLDDLPPEILWVTQTVNRGG